MVWNRILNWFGYGEPELPSGIPTRLPSYFPVQPKGCESISERLFICIADQATVKQREMEKAGYHKSYYHDVQVQRQRPVVDEKIIKALKEQEDQEKLNRDDDGKKKKNKNDPNMRVVSDALPKPDDNPLDECRVDIAYYMRCCDKELKKRHNWILTEPYRVQEEYRYDKGKNEQYMAKK